MEFDAGLAYHAVIAAFVQPQQVAAAGAAPPGSAPGASAPDARTAWSVPHRAARQPTGAAAVAARATRLDDLPPEILRQIATYTPFDDIGSLSTVARHTYYALWDSRRSWLCCERADNVRQLDSSRAHQLLDEIEYIGGAPVLRAAPLQALWPRIPELPQQYQPHAYKRIFEMANRLPTHVALPILEGVIGTLPGLAVEHRLPLYDFVYAAVERSNVDRGRLWAMLAWSLGCLPVDPQHFEREYSVFLNRLPSLDATAQARLLTQLALLLRGFCDNGVHSQATLAGYHRLVYDWVQRLPPSLQGMPVGALAHVIWLLPEPQMSAHYADLRRLTQALPDLQLGHAMRHLPAALAMLPPQHHTAEFALLESMVNRIPAQHREAVALGLLEGSIGLGEALSKRGWQLALRLLDNGDSMQLFAVLDDLAERELLPLLSGQQWADAVDEILQFCERNRLGETDRTMLLDFIARHGTDR
ncbi:F-box protein [Mycetohabitans rhizoxinica]|uniref:F-box protein n=1 Tax=Mycetohabitans rhizoxinica TaxID=412963 RepID=UPI0030CCFBBB